MQDIANLVSLDGDINNVYDIVYSACGTDRKAEFMLSLRSMQLMALSSSDSKNTLYRVHIITGELYMICSTLHGPYAMHHSVHNLFQVEFDSTPVGKADACYADGGLKKDDLQVLEKSSTFLFVLHSPNSIAAPLFAPCSTQRMYLHEHPDFDGIDDVSHCRARNLPLTQHILTHCHRGMHSKSQSQKFMSPMQTCLLSRSGQLSNHMLPNYQGFLILKPIHMHGISGVTISFETIRSLTGGIADNEDSWHLQVVYLDVDTLWIDSMANVKQEFSKMREKQALFGMSVETTFLNGNGSWYKGGGSPCINAPCWLASTCTGLMEDGLLLSMVQPLIFESPGIHWRSGAARCDAHDK